MFLQGSNVSSHLVPLSVIVVGHDGDVVKVLGQHGDVVSLTDDPGGRWNGCRQKKTFRLESLAQLLHPSGEVGLVGHGAGIAVNLDWEKVIEVKTWLINWFLMKTVIDIQTLLIEKNDHLFFLGWFLVENENPMEKKIEISTTQ